MKSWTVFFILAASAIATGQGKPYPTAQTPAAVGQVAPDFTLKDQDGKDFQLSDQRGHRVLLYFYRGYWWPYCMTELREFARHSDELDKLDVRLIPISTDNQQHAHDVWEKAAEKKFTILSDPDAQVIRRYGLLHQAGHAKSDIALRTTLLIGADGREKWRRVSQSVPDIPNWEETLGMIKKSQAE